MFIEIEPTKRPHPSGVLCFSRALVDPVQSGTWHSDGVRNALDAFSINIQLLWSCSTLKPSSFPIPRIQSLLTFTLDRLNSIKTVAYTTPGCRPRIL